MFESVEQQIYGIFERFIIFPDFHCVYHLYERRKILLIFWSFIIDVADQSRVKKRLGLHPKIIAGFAFPFRIGNQHRNQFENVFLAMDIREWIVVHRLPKVNRIEHFDLIRLINDFAFFIAQRFTVFAQLGSAPRKQFAAFHKDGAFRVGNDIGAVHLH